MIDKYIAEIDDHITKLTYDIEVDFLQNGFDEINQEYHNNYINNKFDNNISAFAKQRYEYESYEYIKFMTQLHFMQKLNAGPRLLEYFTNNDDVNINRIILAKQENLTDEEIISLDMNARDSKENETVFNKKLYNRRTMRLLLAEKHDELENVVNNAEQKYIGGHDMYTEYKSYFNDTIWDLIKGHENNLTFMVELYELKKSGASDLLLEYEAKRFNSDNRITFVITLKKLEVSDKKIIEVSNDSAEYIIKVDSYDILLADIIPSETKASDVIQTTFPNHLDTTNIESYMSALPQHEMTVQTCTKSTTTSPLQYLYSASTTLFSIATL